MSTDHLFLTFTHLSDPTRHAEYNAWHQLDHLPENLLLPGVAWGDRWVRTPEHAANSHVGDPTYSAVEYAVAYGFRAPLPESLAAWTDLNRRALWWGRRPELPWTERCPVGFFHPVKGYASPRVLVGPEAVPLRPHRGILLTLSRLADSGGTTTVAVLGEHDRERIPALLAVDGVAGAWTHRFASAGAGFGAAGADDAGLLLRVLYLDGDPGETAALVEEADPAWMGRTSVVDDPEHVLLSSVFESVTPWQWDWFS